MKILLIGDVVGRVGRRVLASFLDKVMDRYGIDLTIANCENAAGGFGITPPIAQEILSLGVGLLTSGNHVWHRTEALSILEEGGCLLRPANYPPGTPGTGSTVLEVGGKCRVGVINVCGRVFMPPVDCPFRAVLREREAMDPGVKVVVVDFHAEATSEKGAMGWFLDGRVSAVLGTHTHVQTSDERVLPGGTAYITDAGMTGPADSVIGMRKEIVIERFLSGLPKRFETAGGEGQFNGVVVEVDKDNGRAQSIARIAFRG